MRAFITGVAGFIGSHLAERLLAEGWEVSGIDDLTTGSASNVPDGVRWAVADIARDDPTELFEAPDVVYHLAASYRDRDNWERDARVNVSGTIRVIRWAQRWDARIVYAQTSLCYGLAPRSPIEPTDPLAPTGSYAVSKTAGESYIRDSGLPWVSLRLANMYGPRNLSGPVPAFFRRLNDGQSCTIVDSRRDFVYVGDLVELALIVGTKGSGVYHAASGTDASVLEVYRAVSAAMHIEQPEPTVVPRGPDDAATLLLCADHTDDELGWRAITPLKDGIAEAVEWYRRYGVRDTFTHLAMKG